jgi:hypothetical protein
MGKKLNKQFLKEGIQMGNEYKCSTPLAIKRM